MAITINSKPLLQASCLTYQFENGETLFSDLSFTLSARLTGLVGRNGVGKSALASILSGQKAPSLGSVVINGSSEYLGQLPSQLINSEQTLAEFLEIEPVLNALRNIELGHCNQQWFDIVGEQWQLESEIAELLKSLGLPVNTSLLCNALSGGQLTRLQLWKLLRSEAELLILDEPSNHLDRSGRQWLVDEIQNFKGSVLLISHDRMLLRAMEQIWELNSLGLSQYGGNYDHYFEQKGQQCAALEKQLDCASKVQKQLQRQIQASKEKADKRASQGERERKKGGMPKWWFNGRKSSAQASAGKRSRMAQSRTEQLQKKSDDLKSQYEVHKRQKLYLPSSKDNSPTLMTMEELVLPYGNPDPITLVLNGHGRLHLEGRNGSGKSTLMNVLLGNLDYSGHLRINTNLCYLDQHFSFLQSDSTVLDNLMDSCEGMKATDARVLLAGIGFRQESVFRKVRVLSGGEKMKLAMLMVSHQHGQPVLLLDEPDNHLDLDSKRILAEALRAYQGAFILISHDEDFISEAGINQKLVL
ncbi:ABC-F family ATP-binding cassette domain-containing protein [Endozoicomonas arenosclerae]|uniref:ABC-F family ATP-binding cassette domain-containing protein n=1 Tax=Endozoicomonas arenosclerae TaxID=1633495 RepID=UPI000786317B|nr:ABC-F family ATP-binding cassette domain-containing protein [Endozoicomonas arenosclerae]